MGKMILNDECYCHKCLDNLLVQKRKSILQCPVCGAWRFSARGYLIAGGCIGFIALFFILIWRIMYNLDLLKSQYLNLKTCSRLNAYFSCIAGITSANFPRFMMQKACENSDMFGSEIIRAGRTILIVESLFVVIAIIFFVV